MPQSGACAFHRLGLAPPPPPHADAHVQAHMLSSWLRMREHCELGCEGEGAVIIMNHLLHS